LWRSFVAKPRDTARVSKADIDVISDQFAAVNERDFERAMSHYADDVVLVMPPGDVRSGRFEGKPAVGRWFGEWFQAFDRDYRFEIDETREIGDLIFVHATHGGHGRASGVEVRDDSSYLYRVRGGKIAYCEMYWERDDALEAAGSPEGSQSEVE
jgi:ketosteroid isomerase-like protein